jgi:hypothetical protein
MTKKLYHINSCDVLDDDQYDRVGEVDFFLTEDGTQIVAWWSKNDANWRPEYMSGLIQYFGGEVKSAWDLPVDVQTTVSVTIAEFVEEHF